MDNNRGGHQAIADQHEIELVKQQLLPSMSKDIEAAPLNESAGGSICSIFRVPHALAGGIAEACRPCFISIGPYHHGELQLDMLQGHKWRCLRTMQDRGIRLENLIDVVAPKEKMIRQCYSESTDNFSGPDLVKMMVLDGCFIIEFLRQFGVAEKPRDMLITNLFMIVSVARDLLRLENQVPYFVLEDLFEATKVPEGKLSLADHALQFFSGVWRASSNVQGRQTNLEAVHLLDLFRLSLIPLDQQDYPVDESSSFNMTRSASELHRVGIGIKGRKASTFLEIKFDRKYTTIEIPEIAIQGEEFNWIITNMVAFEQCQGQQDGPISTYAVLMGCLIRTANDVQLLRDRKVISDPSMSNEDIACFFQNVSKDAVCNTEGSYLVSYLATVNKSLKHERANLCYAQLLNAFRDNPWSALSGLAVVVTLVGIIQTVYAVLQYYHPK